MWLLVTWFPCCYLMCTWFNCCCIILKLFWNNFRIACDIKFPKFFPHNSPHNSHKPKLEHLYESDEYGAWVELDDNYSDEQYSNSEDDAITERVNGKIVKKAKEEHPVTKSRFGSIATHRKVKFTWIYQGAGVHNSKFQLEWQRKWLFINSTER